MSVRDAFEKAMEPVAWDDPARKLAIARRLAAVSLGVDELPPDAEVEMALGEDGVLHVRGSVVVDGYIPVSRRR